MRESVNLIILTVFSPKEDINIWSSRPTCLLFHPSPRQTKLSYVMLEASCQLPSHLATGYKSIFLRLCAIATHFHLPFFLAPISDVHSISIRLVSVDFIHISFRNRVCSQHPSLFTSQLPQSLHVVLTVN